MTQNNGTATWVRWALGIIIGGLIGTTGAWATCYMDNHDRIAENAKAIAAMQATIGAVKEDTTEIKGLLKRRADLAP